MKKSLLSIIALSIFVLGVILYNQSSSGISGHVASASAHVPAYKDWKIHFSQEMNPDSFTKDTVKVLNDKKEPVAVSFEWNEDYTVLTLKSPDEGYHAEENYQIFISNNVESALGVQLAKSISHPFQVVAGLPNIKDQEQLITLLKEKTKNNSYYQFSGDLAAGESADSKGTQTASKSGSTSETNVQVNGIDEGDSVKIVGDYIYFARENDIVITSVKGSESKVISKIQEKGFYIRELFVHDNLLISIGRTNDPIRKPITVTESENGARVGSPSIMPYYAPQSTVHFYDISDKENPKHLREFTMEGYLYASRKMDGILYLLGNNYPPYHILRNEEKVENIDARPFVKDSAVSNDATPVDYDNLYFFPDSDEQNFMLLSTIDLSDMKKAANVQAYLGSSSQLYMSKNHIYTAVRKYNMVEQSSPDGKETYTIAEPANTQINQFKIDGEKITYQASTIVNGTLINQFAMDEQNNSFRVATTKGYVWDEKNPSTNNLYTFDLHLNPLGQVEGLAKGERIYSVRFMENVAYMVTFKQVDPLFVIDLKDAKNPKVLGELKIPGFSTYLHPLDDNHVIGFGQHTELVNTEWSEEPVVRRNGIKISVFDVTDPANPKEKYTEILGSGGSYSEVLYNHRALYKHPEKNLFGFPVSLYDKKTVQKENNTFEQHVFVFEGAVLFEISPDKGITLKDKITHQKEIKQYPHWQWQMKRMVSKGDLLYTLSLENMKVYDLNSEEVVETVILPKMYRSY